MSENMMKIEFSSRSQNESFARVAVASFASQLDPTLEEISDVKTAVSEAVTNAIIHGYGDNKEGKVIIETILNKNEISISVMDEGCGISDIKKAREPLYTSRPDLERSGMGFTVMETFMDSVEIESSENVGTRIRMKKVFSSLE